jgi:carbon monoxide dehydrogenase subunit G
MAKIHYSGSFNIEKPAEAIYGFITDPSKAAGILPGVQSIDVISNDEFMVKMMIGVGHMKGLITARVTISNKEPPRRVKMSGRGTGLQSSMDFELDFTIKGNQGSTEVEWIFDGNVGGLVGAMGARVLDAVAEKMINDSIAKLRKELAQV